MASPCCISGTTHDGSPAGSIKDMHGLKTYYTDGPNTDAKGPVIVFIPDAFGIAFMNNKLLVDNIASAGYRVRMPDFMAGYVCSTAALESMAIATNPKTGLASKVSNYAIAAWHFIPFFIANRFSVCRPRVEDYMMRLRADVGANVKIGVAGYCWGGLYAFHLAGLTTPTGQERLIDCAFAAHPSNLDVPKAGQDVKVPFSVAIGDKDVVLPPAQQEQIEAAMRNTGVDCEFRVYPGATHGFAVRGDPAIPEEKVYLRQARDQLVAWFDKYLK